MDKNTVTFTIPKEIPGEHFDDLDILTKMLSKDPQPSYPRNLVEELDEETIETHANGSITLSGYGFNRGYSGYFSRIDEDYLKEIVDCPNPEYSSVEERMNAKVVEENSRFNMEHYLFDLYDEDGNIRRIMQFESPIQNIASEEIAFTSEEIRQMMSLKRRSLIVDDPESIRYGLVDILLGYCYNKRTTEGENTVESVWTIAKLSSTLSWMIVFKSMDSMLESFMRRSLVYPLYRNWNLSLKVVEDVVKILELGKRAIVKALLEIKWLFDHDETRYVLSRLYIDDYCIWTSKTSNDVFLSLKRSIESCSVSQTGLFREITLVGAEVFLTGENEQVRPEQN